MPLCPTFSLVFWGPNSGPHSFATNTLLTGYLSNPIFVTVTRLQLGCALSKTAVIGSAIVVLVQGFPGKNPFFKKNI